MPFFRVRVRKTLEYQIRVFAETTTSAENKAIKFETNPPVEVLRTTLIDGFPEYTTLNTIVLSDNDNSLSKLYAKNLSEQAMTSLDKIAANLASQVTSDEFYILKDHIELLESTIEVILT